MYVDNDPVAFAGILHRPVSKPQRTGQNLMGVSRIVTLPDWQGLGLAFSLMDTLGAAYTAIGRRLNNYPTHPSFVRSHQRSDNWKLREQGRGGFYYTQRGGTDKKTRKDNFKWKGGSRPNWTFNYCGPAMDINSARELLSVYHPND